MLYLQTTKAMLPDLQTLYFPRNVFLYKLGFSNVILECVGLSEEILELRS